MAKLHYAEIIAREATFTTLADLSKRLEKLDQSQIMTSLVDLVPSGVLPLLAEKWSLTGLDGWHLAESDETKRKLIRQAVELHRHKGSVWAVREIIRQLGFGEVLIEEGGKKKHNGEIKLRNGFHQRGSVKNWATYQIIFLNKPISKKSAEKIALAIQQYAPARCVLEGMTNQKGLLKHNGKINRTGLHNRGGKWIVKQKIV